MEGRIGKRERGSLEDLRFCAWWAETVVFLMSWEVTNQRCVNLMPLNI